MRFALQLLFLGTLTTAARAEPVFRGDFTAEPWLTHFTGGQVPPWTEGMTRASTTQDAERGHRVLEVRYPKGGLGNEETGVQWLTYLPAEPGEPRQLTVTYAVRFAPGFDFVKGGKLPGLVGGHQHGKPHSTLTGGHKPDGKDGWSARVMWRKDGRIVQYVYHPDQPDKFGEDFAWTLPLGGAAAKFVPGRWQVLKTEVTLNAPGKRDGRIRSWLDDELALDARGLRFRDVPTIGIDALYVSTFFGGDSPDWAAAKDETVRFDAFVVER